MINFYNSVLMGTIGVKAQSVQQETSVQEQILTLRRLSGQSKPQFTVWSNAIKSNLSAITNYTGVSNANYEWTKEFSSNSGNQVCVQFTSCTDLSRMTLSLGNDDLITAISQQRTELSNSFLQTNRQQSFNVNSKTNYIQLKFTSATAKTNIKKLEFTGAPSNDSSCKLVPPKNKIPFQLTNDYTEPSSVVVVTQPI